MTFPLPGTGLSAAGAVRPRAWDDVILGNTVTAWSLAIGGALVGTVIALVGVRWVKHIVLPRAERTDSTALRSLGAGLAGIRARLLVPIALLLACGALTFEPRPAYWLRLLAFTLIGVQLAVSVNRMLVVWIRRPAERAGPVPVMTAVLTWAAQFLVWLTVGLLLLANAGVNITAFVASLGVGGIAVALGLQNILGDLFASISIGLDKPFAPGDYIAFGTDQGTVTKVGIKSTRIRALSGEELAIANSKLLESLVHNYSRMPARRIEFGFTVPFDTPPEKLTAIVTRTGEIIAAQPGVSFDRGHLTGFDDSGFTFAFVYVLSDPAYAHFRDVHQDIHFGILALLAELDVPVAVPVRSVTVMGDRPD